MRNLERISESECAQPADITRLQDQLDSLRSNNLDLKVREERSAALIQEMKIELSQQREDKGVNGNIMQNTKEPTRRPRGRTHRHLTKSVLRSWMSEVEAQQEDIKNNVKHLQEKFESIKKENHELSGF